MLHFATYDIYYGTMHLHQRDIGIFGEFVPSKYELPSSIYNLGDDDGSSPNVHDVAESSPCNLLKTA